MSVSQSGWQGRARPPKTSSDSADSDSDSHRAIRRPAPAAQGCETDKLASTTYFGDGSLHVRSSVSTNMHGDSTFCVSICILVSIELALALQFTLTKIDENAIFRDRPS